MMEYAVLFLAGMVIGYAVRPVYYLLTGRDIPLLGREFEISREKEGK